MCAYFHITYLTLDQTILDNLFITKLTIKFNLWLIILFIANFTERIIILILIYTDNAKWLFYIKTIYAKVLLTNIALINLRAFLT